jgi:histidinol-phosphate aminotransferase
MGKLEVEWTKAGADPDSASEGIWKANIRRVVPYTAGEQPKEEKVIKLNTNECPYPPAPGVAEAAAAINCEDLRLYPDPDSSILTKELAIYYGVKPSQVFVGVGSDDVLSMAFLTFFHGEQSVLFPDVTYSFYDVWAKLYQIPYETVPLTKEWKISPSSFSRPNGGIIFPNPNAPTGLALSLEEVEEIVKANQKSVVIVDEAYVDFGGVSALPLLADYDNLLVVGTFSKSRSLAGLRIGFAMGNETLIQYLQDVKFSVNSYTMNLPSQIMGAAALRDQAYFEETIQKVVTVREETKKKLRELDFEVLDSKGNFLFVTHKYVSAKEIFEALREQHIYVRYWDKPRINNHLRITIGTSEEMKALTDFLEKWQAERENK